jgi:hypothetical protein
MAAGRRRQRFGTLLGLRKQLTGRKETMNQRSRLFGLAAAAAFAFLLGQLASAQGNGPTGVLSDDLGNKVRSDAQGPYVDGLDCVSVIAGSAGGGFYQIRTVANSDQCNSQTWEARRFLTLDFDTGFTFDLDHDPCDSDPTVEAVPSRFIAGEAFARRAVTTSVTILVLAVNESGTTTQDTAWELRYRNRANVVVNGDGSRDIFLDQGFATADLFEYVQVVKKGRVVTQTVLRGTYDMPFHVTAREK